jgi:hypothetical protein
MLPFRANWASDWAEVPANPGYFSEFLADLQSLFFIRRTSGLARDVINPAI